MRQAGRPASEIHKLPARFAPVAAGTTAAGASAAAGTTATTAAEAARAAEAAFRLRTRFIYVQSAAIERVAVQRGDRLIRLRFALHLYKREPSGPARIAVGHN